MNNNEKEIISKALEYVKPLMSNDYSGHDFTHIQRILQLATHIGLNEGGNLFIIQLAAVLHDLDDRKISPETNDDLYYANVFLQECGLDENTIGSINQIINELAFVGIDTLVPSTIEGKCVQDADRLDGLGAIGISRAFAYGGAMNKQYFDPLIEPLDDIDKTTYYSNNSTTINHFFEKLLKVEELLNTDTAKKIASERTRFMEEFLKHFFEEWSFDMSLNKK